MSIQPRLCSTFVMQSESTSISTYWHMFLFTSTREIRLLIETITLLLHHWSVRSLLTREVGEPRQPRPELPSDLRGAPPGASFVFVGDCGLGSSHCPTPSPPLSNFQEGSSTVLEVQEYCITSVIQVQYNTSILVLHNWCGAGTALV